MVSIVKPTAKAVVCADLNSNIDGTDAATRPMVSIREALDSPRRYKCLAIKDLPTDTPTFAAELGYNHALDLVRQIPDMEPLTPAEQRSSEITVDKLLGTVDGTARPLAKAYHKSKTATADQIKNFFRNASCWAIVNGKGSFTREHHDAAGSATHFVVHKGEKVWFIRTPGGKVEIVVLQPGDAVVMAPGVKHCVYTLETSVCIGGHGWLLEDVPRCYEALKQEHRDGSNETLPLWYPVLSCFAIEMAKKQDDATARKLRSVLLACLETPFVHLSGKPPANSIKIGDTVADFGVPDIAAVLKYCQVPAARAVKALRG